MVILLPTASSDTPHGNHPIDAQEHHSSGKRCTVQERTPPHGGICSSTRRPCVAARKEHARQTARSPSPGHHVQHSHAHAKHHGSRVSKKMPWAPTRRFPRQLSGSSGSGEHLECPWHAQRCHLIQCAASNQDRPTPIATVNGTARSMAPPIASVTTSRTRCSSLGATSRTSSSWICSSTRERSPCSASP